MYSDDVLFQINEEELQNIQISSDFSPVYRILMMDYSASHSFGIKSSLVLGKIEYLRNQRIWDLANGSWGF